MSTEGTGPGASPAADAGPPQGGRVSPLGGRAGAEGTGPGASTAADAGPPQGGRVSPLGGRAGAEGAGPGASEWPLWEVFVRSKAGLDHKHCGSLHAPDSAMAIQMARDVYTRRQEGSSVWIVRSDQIVASDPGDKDMYFDPAEDKVYRHPTFYKLPDEVDHM